MTLPAEFRILTDVSACYYSGERRSGAFRVRAMRVLVAPDTGDRPPSDVPRKGLMRQLFGRMG